MSEARLQPLRRLTSVAAPLWIEDVDTDQLIPGRLCVRPAGASYADALLAHWRFDKDGAEIPEFVLNREPYRRAAILLSGANFGCGSSREHAAWALRDFGIRAIIAPSFAEIFHANAVRSGIAPVVLPASTVAALADSALAEPAELTVDLERQLVLLPDGGEEPFDFADLDRELLLEGKDATDLVASWSAEIDAFQHADRARRPWVYLPR